MVCRICFQPFDEVGVSQYAAYGGLPSPCCEICFEANDYRINNLIELAVKSLEKRKSKGIEIVSKELTDGEQND